VSNYRKLIVAILVPLVGFGLKAAGVDIEFGEEQANSLMNFLIPILTALGVWGAPNTET
jgi:hypothetical protein